MSRAANSDVSSNAVDCPIVGCRTLSIDAELAAIEIIICCNYYSGRELNECLEAPAIHWQIFRKLTIHNRTDGCVLCVHERRTTFHGHRFRRSAYLKRKINRRGILHMKNDLGLHYVLEAIF